MADHSKPTLSSTYPNFLNEVKGRLEDISKQFDPAQGAASNVVAGTVRWSSSSKKWEQWNGTAWGDLATEYAINTSGSAAKLKTARSIAVSGGATAAAVPFDGSANVTLNVTALNPAQLSAVVPLNKGGTGSATAEQARVNLGLGSAATTNAADYAAKSHAHAWGEITGKPATFPPVIGGAANQAKAGNWNPSWGEVQGKPATFPPVVGYAAHQAKPGNWLPAFNEISGGLTPAKFPVATLGAAFQVFDDTGSFDSQASGWATLLRPGGTSGIHMMCNGNVRLRFSSGGWDGAGRQIDVHWIRILRNGVTVTEIYNNKKGSAITQTVDIPVSVNDVISFQGKAYEGRSWPRTIHWVQITSGVACLPAQILYPFR